ncbi:hypothetical protein AB205_0098090 [Aquarana catesbeiana]|uniref:Uncharacterized protein n=1 Tax=Aquarana catesbeiana TaxID=8400 RepID=A0A2G9Q727_AQUCT|nr:hypothetical protein AB205_0098090 [Aquarana catesbeiana]
MLIHIFYLYTASFVKTVLYKIHVIRKKKTFFFAKYDGTGLDIHLGLDNLLDSQNLVMWCRCV